MERKKLAIIYMASGFGRRFGSNKLLHDYKGKPLYRHGLDRLIACKAPSLLVYVISHYPEIEAYCKEKGICYVDNPDAAQGITASIHYGIRAAGQVDGYIFLTADQPNLKEETLLAFAHMALESEKSMGSICCEGQPGSPTFFTFAKREELLSLKGDRGGRSLMKASPQDVFWYEISKEEWKDIDRLEDL